MKSTFRTIICLAVAIAAASCDFLEEIPATSLVSEQVYDNESAVNSAFEGCYKSLGNLVRSEFLQQISGASILQYNAQNQLDSWFNHTLYSNDSNNNVYYRYLYEAIGRYNYFLDGVSSSPLPEEKIKSMSAEVRFLRAFTYFFLVRIYGDVPLILEKVVTIDQACVPRTHYTKVYKAILDELDYAEKNMKPMSEMTLDELQKSHCCNYAATALKAKVYVQIASLMTSAANGIDDQWFDLKKEGRYPDFSECGIPKDDVEEAWKKALACAEDVITNGPFSLEPDYANLFRFDRVNHPEDYLSKERILVYPQTPALTSGAYASWSLPKQPWGSEDPTTGNGNKLRIRPERLTWEMWCSKYGDDSDYKEEDDNVLGLYTFFRGCADPRLDATYFNTVYYTGDYTKGEDAKTMNLCYPYFSTGSNNRISYFENVNFSNFNTAYSLNCVPIYKKGFSRTYRGNNTTGDADVYLFRYADVLLLAAEAACNLHQVDKSVGYVNKILERARKSTNYDSKYLHTYGEAKDAAAPADWKVSDYQGNEKKLLLDILWERVFEMEYELQHFFDTRRYGANYLVDNFVRPYNEFMHQSANYRLWQSPMWNYGRDKTEDISLVRAGLLIAYPEYEILNNTAIDYTTGKNDFFIQ